MENLPSSSSCILPHIQHNTELFGEAQDLNADLIPTYGDILRYFFFLYTQCKDPHIKPTMSLKNLTPHVADKVLEIWHKLPIEIILRRSVVNKLNRFMDSYAEIRKSTKVKDNREEFVNSLKNVFSIAKCNCNLKTSVCKCGNTPLIIKAFMVDQYTDRQQTITTFLETLPQPTTVTSTEFESAEHTSDPSWRPQMEMEVEHTAENIETEENEQQTLARGPYIERIQLPWYS